MDYSNLTKEEKLDLYDRAKVAYYETGKPIMTDADFDKLEKELGLENKSYIGSGKKGRGNYTIPHTFNIGSLNKIHYDDFMTDGDLDWKAFAAAFDKVFAKANHPKYFETTPKLDGCSFSVEFTIEHGDPSLMHCSGRGDGSFGNDMTHLFKPQLKTDAWSKIYDACDDLLEEGDILCIRGEVLIPHSVFNEKYASKYADPRSFVSGHTNQKADNVSKSAEALVFVCYDYRIVEAGTNKYAELSWMNPNDPTYKLLAPYLGHIGTLPDSKFCQVHEYNGKMDPNELRDIYMNYLDFRNSNSEFALDGIVFKPEASTRLNPAKSRPDDCIALKYEALKADTEIINIMWEAKKSGEYRPVGILKPIEMFGKRIQKASLYNYNWIIQNECGIGSVVNLMMCGDIIPGVNKVLSAAGADNLNLPYDAEIVETKTGYKLMKTYDNEDDRMRDQFLISANELKIPNIGPAAASKLWDGLHNDVKNLDNILAIADEDIYCLIFSVFGEITSVKNIVNSLRTYADNITIYDIIRSCCIPGCRDKTAKVCEKIITGQPYDLKSLNKAGYEWALDKNSDNYKRVIDLIEFFGIDINSDDYIEDIDNEKIPIVMTGSPKEFGYKTKSEFLAAHPEYEDVGSSIKDCQILFTDDLTSTSGKMKQAQKLGVDIKLYY